MHRCYFECHDRYDSRQSRSRRRRVVEGQDLFEVFIAERPLLSSGQDTLPEEKVSCYVVWIRSELCWEGSRSWPTMACVDCLALVFEHNTTSISISRTYLASRKALSAGRFCSITANATFSARMASDAGSAVHHCSIRAISKLHEYQDVASK
jgi:hypothetical protein